MIFKNNQIYQLNHDEGRATYDYVNSKWVYEYDYRDVWGNLRLSFRDSLTANKPPVITQSSDYDMIGYEISSYSNQNKNKFLFQKQERISDFDLDIDLFKYRPSDSKIGRFWQIDPLATKYVYNSPYALQENKFGLGIELEGAELKAFLSQVSDFMAGSNAAVLDNQLPISTTLREAGAKGRNASAYNAGQTFGDVLSIVQGAGETLLGIGGDAGAAVVTVMSGGAATPVTVPAAVVSTGLIAHGVSVGAKASSNLSDRMTNSSGDKKSGGREDGVTTKKDRVSNQKPGERAQNQYEGIEKAQQAAKKQAREEGMKQNKINSIDKSKQKENNQFKRTKSLEDAKENF